MKFANIERKFWSIGDLSEEKQINPDFMNYALKFANAYERKRTENKIPGLDGEAFFKKITSNYNTNNFLENMDKEVHNKIERCYLTRDGKREKLKWDTKKSFIQNPDGQ